MAGAFVTSYAAAVDVQAAIAAAVAKLRALDFIFEDIEGAARELPAASWSTYVAAVWPDYTGRLPLQAELPTLIGRGDTG